MRKVLVPMDFSKNAFNALKYACQVFKYEKSEILILHTFADQVYEQESKATQGLEELKESTLGYSEEQLKKVLHDINLYAPNPKHTYKTLAVFGSLVDEVNTFVNQENIDVVVMGTKGKTNESSITFGSNTLQVLKYVHCPVMAIPEGYAYNAPREILFPTNYLVPYKKRELKLLCEMSGSFRSTIHFLYIDPLKELSKRQADNKFFLESCLYKPKLAFEATKEKDKTVAITNYVDHKKIDLVVIVNSRHSYMEDMLYQSTIDKIGLQLKIPFMVLQNIAR